MQEIKFDGELRNIAPARIIDEKNGGERIDEFFLTLGIAYNDLKSLHFYLVQMKNFFEEKGIQKQIEEKHPTCELGEYSGMKNHMERLITSTMHETFLLINKYNDVFNLEEVKIMLINLSNENRNIWKDLISIANYKNLTDKGNKFRHILERVRQNGGFHYHGIGKLMKNGFKDHFFIRKNNSESNSAAFWAKGDSMEQSRYFFSDASIQGFYFNLIKSNMSEEDYAEAILTTMREMNVAIMVLMKEYILSRPFK
jgi:hypothetical protein